jgi:integrase/recombinase XerD
MFQSSTLVSDAARCRRVTTSLALAKPDPIGEQLMETYKAGLGSDKSRSTFVDSLRRVSRLYDVEEDDFARIPWTRFDYVAMTRLQAYLRKKYTPQTANMTLSHVRSVVRVGFILGHVPERAWLGVKEVKAVRGSRTSRGRALSKKELVALLETCATAPAPRGAMLRAVLLLGVGTGLRLNEICTLAIGGVRDGKVVVMGKGAHESDCVLDAATGAAIDEWLAIRHGLRWSHRRLFGSPARGRVLSPGWLWRLLSRLQKEAGVAKFAPHDLRRTFASRIFELGFDLREVQQLMGHASPDTTARYDKRGRLQLEAKRRNVAVFDLEAP